ncbi:hypothetical protein [Mycoplasma bradburyae]|uniref:hypothetical protein n=1 Tax=Mycoplasma bradburyae TaxID=2963128 RepID=UPI0023427863|nr:hypothetical protein [Mycoplasma bradburyae]MDC4182812.1 hypothetical protein [Mycoplasma bradburyae]
MVNDNNKATFETLTNYIAYVKKGDLKVHWSLNKKQLSLSLSSFVFLTFTAFFVLVLACNVFYIVWSAFNNTDINNSVDTSMMLDKVNNGWSVNLAFFVLSLTTLICEIGFVLRCNYLLNFKKVITPIKLIKRSFNFINAIVLICLSLSLLFIVSGFGVYANFNKLYNRTVPTGKFFDEINQGAIISQKTLLSAILGIFFTLSPTLLLASLLIYSVFVVQYHVFTSFYKITRAIRPLVKELVLQEKLKAKEDKNKLTILNEQEEELNEKVVEVIKQKVTKPNVKENINIDQNNVNDSINNNQTTQQTPQPATNPNLDSLFKKMYANNSINPNPDTKSTQAYTQTYPNQNNINQTHNVNVNNTQSFNVNPTPAQQTINSQEVNNNINPTSSLKDIIKKINTPTKSFDGQNQANNQTQSVNSSQQTNTNNINPGDLYKNIFKFKTPFATSNPNNNNQQNNDDDLPVGIGVDNQQEKDSKLLKELLKNVKK